jgi:hypothetical protein
MVEDGAIATLPARPPSEVEWEDLLLRVELMTRALRNAAEELAPGAGAAELERMLEREARVGEWLEGHAMPRSAAGGTERAATSSGATTWGDVSSVDRLVSLRSRNFAMVQRRGLGVWEWRAAFDGVEVTSYQLLGWLVREDVQSLARLRAAGRGEAAAC